MKVKWIALLASLTSLLLHGCVVVPERAAYVIAPPVVIKPVPYGYWHEDHYHDHDHRW